MQCVSIFGNTLYLFYGGNTMHKCLNCGTEFEGKFCNECGAPWQEEKICPNCGTALKGNAKFCNECGYSFAQQTTTPAQIAVKNQKNDKLYLVLHYLPAILLGLFSVLVFAFLGAPAVKLTVTGIGSAADSGYEVLKDETLFSLKDCFVAMIVFACFTAIAAVLTAFALHKRPATKFHPVLLIGFILYAVYLILGSVAIAQVKDLDGGAGMLSADACPILLIVFSILFALGAVGSVIGAKMIPSSYFKQNVKINLDKNKLILWLGRHQIITYILFIALLTGVISSCLIPTFNLTEKNGTYYACMNGEIYKENYIVLKDGAWTDESGASGKYTVSGSKIVVHIQDDASNVTVSVIGTVKNGVLILESDSICDTYCTDNHVHKYNDGICACGVKQST